MPLVLIADLLKPHGGDVPSSGFHAALEPLLVSAATVVNRGQGYPACPHIGTHQRITQVPTGVRRAEHRYAEFAVLAQLAGRRVDEDAARAVPIYDAQLHGVRNLSQLQAGDHDAGHQRVQTEREQAAAFLENLDAHGDQQLAQAALVDKVLERLH
ncbi:efflux RND transporter permease subunit [Babesia caballi]|uniref:Efflux RND transporter permease subunit n=1 Tax=Babesia caballi TaxID=5871 RepID=A0AAV4LT90_BABCB|nr:efflux RND transporter permease subunit [Babesia caballi]